MVQYCVNVLHINAKYKLTLVYAQEGKLQSETDVGAEERNTDINRQSVSCWMNYPDDSHTRE